MLTRLSTIALLTAIALPAIAQTIPAVELPLPQIRELQLKPPDPLLPKETGRVLSLTEQQNLKLALDKLDQQATTLLEAKDAKQAFAIWLREVRLRQALGPMEEVKALRRVGALAWRENQRPLLDEVIFRLPKLQQQVQTKLSRQGIKTLPLPFLQELASAYEAVRLVEPALATHQQLLTLARQANNQRLEEDSLAAIARLNLNWFRYTAASQTYEELLPLLQKRGRIGADRAEEIAILKSLAVAYGEIGNGQRAIAVQSQLIAIYQAQNNRRAIPPLQVTMANHYAQLKELNTAAQLYQSAYRLAMSLQQFADAADALKPLGTLYRDRQQWDDALQIYQVLLEVEQRSYNSYGQMQTYDQIGQVYQAKQAYDQARTAFQNGLQLAQQLQVQESYFQTKLQQVGP